MVEINQFPMTNPTIEPTDEAIVRRVLQGDTAAYRLIVDRYQDVMFACALAITTNAADAQDAAQEAFIRLYRALNQFDLSRPLKPYLLRIAVNCSRTIVATRRHWQPLEEMPEPVAERPDSAVEACSAEQRAAVRTLINRLPQTLREVCSLFYLADHSCREVAEILQMNETAVKVALHRARKKLLELGLNEWRCA